jgi:hypothetical protein
MRLACRLRCFTATGVPIDAGLTTKFAMVRHHRSGSCRTRRMRYPDEDSLYSLGRGLIQPGEDFRIAHIGPSAA